ncbi:hypothetical protein K438DRAFT_1507092, partial [Mycena galopus ATCC 62051]
PFGLHDEHALPWGYEFCNGVFTLRAIGCWRLLGGYKNMCYPCVDLRNNTILAGIMERICEGLHENAPFRYHPVANLINFARRKNEQVRQQGLLKLNATRTI